MRTINAPPYVAVVSIERGTFFYVGESYRCAAEALNPGTCYGRGITPAVAIAEASQWAQVFMEQRRVKVRQSK